ncbi:MAG: pantoate--beta-alanine ligase [Nevskiales bacterium]
MHILERVSELRAQVSTWRAGGERIAFVPTMGNLHAGHLRLVEEAKRHASRVAVSIFVNPLQFGANEDFDRYPRTFEADRKALASVQADVLFMPGVGEMYPLGQGAVKIEVPGLSDILCGAQRPGHFTGVATVVSILFNQVQPDIAVFGEKDYQQLAVIRRFTKALQLPIEILGVPTEREASGLALSSRNQYLSVQEREQIAPRLYRSLQTAATRLQSGERDFAALEAEAASALTAAGLQVDYVAIRTPELTAPLQDQREFVLLAAAHLGTTRLIDNLKLFI